MDTTPSNAAPAATPAPRPSGFGRDHVLTLLVGALAGFIGGYLVAQKQAPAVASMPAPAAAVNPAGGGPSIPPDLQQKIAGLEAMHEKNHDDVDIALQLGHAYYDTQQWEAAKNVYEEVLPKRDKDPNLLTDLGVCYRNLGDTDRALALFDKAAALDKTHWQSRYNQAIVYTFDQGQQEKAKAILAELVKNPQAAEAATRLQRAIEAHSSTAMPAPGN